jgi:acetylornithine deacetylase/succinyl-diaminopimelate desuccinylase-like protein
MTTKLADPAAAVRDQHDRIRGDLERLVRIPSISAPGFPREHVEACAEEVAAIFREAGCAGVRLEPIDGGPPAVVADILGPPGTPTVLLYAHYDVQPTGDLAAWTNPPFEPAERDGRLFGRGAADDKSGVVMHAATLRAFAGDPPVGIKLLIEGEEETDSHLEAHVERHAERFGADVYVIADVGNFRLGQPTITTTLRGLATCRVSVRTLREPVHSGMFGGPVPDALMTLVRLLATLHDDRGDVAVAGLDRNAWDGIDYPEDAYREVTGVLDGVPRIGTGTVSEMLWARPSINVIGLDAPSVAQAANVLVPSATAIVSARIVPGTDPVAARAALAEHLRTNAPWGVDVEVEEVMAGEGYAAEHDGTGFRAAVEALRDAYGTEPSFVGQGGSIPLANVLSRTAPGGHGEVILWGAQDEAARIHGIDESVDLQELDRCVEQQVRFLQLLGRRADPTTDTKGTDHGD